MNSCKFIGRFTRDPELKDVGETKVVNFSLAVDRRVKDKKAVDFLDFEAWDTGAELIDEHFRKGDAILVDCLARNDQWEDTEGNKRSKVRFRVNSFEFLPTNKKREAAVTENAESF